MSEIERLRAAGYEVTDKDGWFNARNAIIEECARVAYECTTGIEACRKIRALKDKP